MGNPKRGRDSRGNLPRFTTDDRLRRGTKRMNRAERRGDVDLISASFPHPGFVSRLLFGDSRRR